MACGKLDGLPILSVILPCLACSLLTLKARELFAAFSLTVVAAGRLGAPLAACVAAAPPTATAATATAAGSFFERKCLTPFDVVGTGSRGSTQPTPARFAATRCAGPR